MPFGEVQLGDGTAALLGGLVVRAVGPVALTYRVASSIAPALVRRPRAGRRATGALTDPPPRASVPSRTTRATRHRPAPYHKGCAAPTSITRLTRRPDRTPRAHGEACRRTGPTITAMLEDGPLEGSSIETEGVEGRPPKTIDVPADDGTTCRYCLADWVLPAPVPVSSRGGTG
jgi:hypothetical protein